MKRFDTRDASFLPSHFYNLKADLPNRPLPPLHPGTKEPISPEDMAPLFPRAFIEHEMTEEREVPIPGPVLEAMSAFRPTPLIYARELRRALNTKSHIFYKYEGAGPTGSHKSNTALMQAYLAAQEGVRCLTTETGAGQWGCALAHAGAIFGVDVKVFMVRVSYRQKPGRRILCEMFGASIVESPSPLTRAGRVFHEVDPDHPGSLGIAISEAIEAAVTGEGTKYSLGSVLDAVLMHQTVIGLEAKDQLREAGVDADVVIGCVGGGSNFGGISFPFVGERLRSGKEVRVIAVEPEACPTLTKGTLQYDHGDTAGMTPLMHMHSLGKDFIPPPIHAGGLRYHGAAPLVSHLLNTGLIEARAYPQDRVFEAARLFFRTEGILPAPESAHAIAAAIDTAREYREEEKVIVFNLSGHGFLDISAYNGGSH
ncbi:MAG TPA: TrpB-like pyridoxal phosphate-dependent enzyme [Thermoanaerobaculia bacterium]|nr:TrpB-like pyridoxal phosphate-dependent enzyme [Thermoanaerobaculia bacterium]HUM29591.1 TrpB-like pyridoxal phosphate-dependent enzyme [Thermoanaerobaculia bacterium]HXK67242.1 TrpB-like pyridoxal phosphate-dependent enzyme [Thermoanaerobaculia bacterium]